VLDHVPNDFPAIWTVESQASDPKELGGEEQLA
jgi:hypothetical protein